MKFKKGFKYQLVADELYQTDILGYDIDTQFIALGKSGLMVLKTGYACDGPSGPTIDTDDFMRPSFGHDGLYQLMREEHLPQKYRRQADKLMKKWCIEEGMPKFRADYCYAAVRALASGAALPENKRRVFTV